MAILNQRLRPRIWLGLGPKTPLARGPGLLARAQALSLSLLCALLRSEGKQNSRIPRTSFPFKMEIELKEVTRVTKFDYFLFS